MSAVAFVSLVFLICGTVRAQDSSSSAPTSQSKPEQIPAAQNPAPDAGQTTPTSFDIIGTVRAGKTPLPGVTVTAANTLTGKKFSVATAVNGGYTFTGLPRGRYVVRVEFMGFATQTQEVTLKPETPSGKFDAEMILASRQQEEQGEGVALAAAAIAAAGRGFQSLAVQNTLSALIRCLFASFPPGWDIAWAR